MAQVRCGMIGDTRPMADCITCDNHIKEGTSLEWCGYRKPEPPKAPEEKTDLPINAMEMQLREKKEKADYFYRRGWIKAAEKMSSEAAHLEIKLRGMKKNERIDA